MNLILRPFLLLLMPACVFAQDKILLMNGSEMTCRVKEDSGIVLTVEMTKKNGKTKVREVHKNDIFSFTPEGGSEHILYVQDSLFGDIYSEDQMRMYLAGQRDGRGNYNALPTAAVGVLVCGTASYLGGDGLLTAVLPPVIFGTMQLIPKIRIREKFMSDTNYKYNEIYADGFEPPARTRKILSGLSGGFVGSTLGVVLYFITK